MSNKQKLVKIDLNTKVNTKTYKQFIANFDTGQPSTDKTTDYHIVPENRLVEQGMLLRNYILYPKSHPRNIKADNLQKSLFDAAFKCDFGDGDTALILAIRAHNKKTAALLIEKATPEQCFMQNDIGTTALMCAIDSGNKETAALLIKKGSAEQCFIQNEDGQPALMWAINHSNKETAALLIEKATTLDQLFLHDTDIPSASALDRAIKAYNNYDTDESKVISAEIIKLFAEKAIALGGADRLQQYFDNPIVTEVLMNNSKQTAKHQDINTAKIKK